MFNGKWTNQGKYNPIQHQWAIEIKQWLTCKTKKCSLWIRRGITSSLHVSSVICRIWSVLGSDSPSPQSINLIVEKFFPTSSNAYMNLIRTLVISSGRKLKIVKAIFPNTSFSKIQMQFSQTNNLRKITMSKGNYPNAKKSHSDDKK